jgi:hypothetical protein
MTKSCYSSQNSPAPTKGCRPNRTNQESPDFSVAAKNLDVESLRHRIAAIGSTDVPVYGYVVRSVRPKNGEYVQRGSGPNFNGGLITLCTCKHSMRASLTPEQWQGGVWIAGLTSWDKEFNKQQSLVYLMRVGEAYASQVELFQEFNRSGRAAVIESKNSTKRPLGDLMIPARETVTGADRFSPDAYHIPMLGHAHRENESDIGWRDDIDYLGVGGRQAAMLVGDADFSFMWTQPIVRRRNPSHTRPYRIWTLTSFLDDLEAVPV